MSEPLKGKKQNWDKYSGLTVYDMSKCFDEFFSKDDVKSAVEGMYDEFTRAIMKTSVLDPINIVRHFGDLQMKWFADAIDNDTKERVK